MTDTLIERLRNWEHVYDEDDDKPEGSLYLEAADRIEELEAERKMTKQNDWANKMWSNIFKEMSTKGDALMDLFDSVCIIRLRQVVEWSLQEMWRIKERKNITDTMWEDYAELSADVLAAERLLEYFGASTGDYNDSK